MEKQLTKYQSKLHEKLSNHTFVYTTETTPPDASDQDILLTKIMPLKGVVDAVNVTDNPGAKVHMSALTASIILSLNNVESILQLTVRDRNRLSLQGDLVGASALGVHNILCLSGDDPKKGDQPKSIAVNDINSLKLIEIANTMRRDGKFLSGRAIEPSPKLFIGSAEAPSQKKPNLEKIMKKIKSGADFFQTQYVFDELLLKKYMKVLNDAGVPQETSFLIGLGPFASAKRAKWMNDNLYGVNIPEKIIKRLEQSKNQKEESKKICIELIQVYREIDGVRGVHLMGYNKEKEIAEIIKEVKKS